MTTTHDPVREALADEVKRLAEFYASAVMRAQRGSWTDTDADPTGTRAELFDAIDRLASSPAVAAEPDWIHLKQYGYAPGDYMNRCHACEKVVAFVDKRAAICRPCAEAKHAMIQAAPPASSPAASQVKMKEPKRLLGWRTSDYRMETADKAMADNWAPHHDLLPIFEGDPYTKLCLPIPEAGIPASGDAKSHE